MSCCCGCGLALAMAEAENLNRCEAEARLASGRVEGTREAPVASGAPTVRGWEALKAALRHLVGSERTGTVPHIASAA